MLEIVIATITAIITIAVIIAILIQTIVEVTITPIVPEVKIAVGTVNRVHGAAIITNK